MKKHMKSANMKVMFGLLAVLFISLGYLSMQGREGMTGGKEEEKKKEGMTGQKKKEGMVDKKKGGIASLLAMADKK